MICGRLCISNPPAAFSRPPGSHRQAGFAAFRNATWADQHAANLARLEAHGPVMRDLDTWVCGPENLASAPTWHVLG